MRKKHLSFSAVVPRTPSNVPKNNEMTPSTDENVEQRELTHMAGRVCNGHPC